MFGGPPGPGWEWLQASIDRVPGMGKLKGVLGTAFQMAPNSLGAAARGHIVLIGTGAGIVAVLFHHGGYSFLWSLSAVTAAATFALCQLRGDSELQQLKLLSVTDITESDRERKYNRHYKRKLQLCSILIEMGDRSQPNVLSTSSMVLNRETLVSR